MCLLDTMQVFSRRLLTGVSVRISDHALEMKRRSLSLSLLLLRSQRCGNIFVGIQLFSEVEGSVELLSVLVEAL